MLLVFSVLCPLSLFSILCPPSSGLCFLSSIIYRLIIFGFQSQLTRFLFYSSLYVVLICLKILGVGLQCIIYHHLFVFRFVLTHHFKNIQIKGLYWHQFSTSPFVLFYSRVYVLGRFLKILRTSIYYPLFFILFPLSSGLCFLSSAVCVSVINHQCSVLQQFVCPRTMSKSINKTFK